MGVSTHFRSLTGTMKHFRSSRRRQRPRGRCCATKQCTRRYGVAGQALALAGWAGRRRRGIVVIRRAMGSRRCSYHADNEGCCWRKPLGLRGAARWREA